MSAWIAFVGLACPVSLAAAQTIVPKQVQLSGFARCLVKQAPRLSAKLLQTPIGQAEEREAAATLATSQTGCLHGQSVLSGRTGEIRGAVAEAMFAHEPALLDRLAARPSATPVRPDESLDGRAFVIAYATCLTNSDSKNVAALLRTGFSTTEERDAMSRFGDALKDCMPKGVRYTVNIPDLRNHIAAVAYTSVSSGAEG